jgi:cleavage and polyadenylation specificity factor subunit 3
MEQGGVDDLTEPSFIVRLDEADASIGLASLTVRSTSEVLRKRVEAVLDMAITTVSSLSESLTSGLPVKDEESQAPSQKTEKPAIGNQNNGTDAAAAIISGTKPAADSDTIPPEFAMPNTKTATVASAEATVKSNHGEGGSDDDDGDEGSEADAELQIHG